MSEREKKDWRRMLTEIGGYENEFTAVPAGAVRKMIDEIEALRAAQITPQAGEAEDGRYSLGLCADGCAILYDGVPVTVDDVIRRLNRTAPPRPVCDGNHAAPARADPECWQRPSPVAPEPTPEGMCRAALLWVLWHHQGGSSDVGQPIRFALGMGAHEPLSAEQVEAAKSYGALTKKWPPDSPGPTEANT